MSAAAAVPLPGPGGGVRQLRWPGDPGRAAGAPEPPVLRGRCPRTHSEARRRRAYRRTTAGGGAEGVEGHDPNVKTTDP